MPNRAATQYHQGRHDCIIKMAGYSSLKVPELKKLLAERNLPQTGNKADLIARLQEADQNEAPADADKPGKADKEDEITYTDDEETAPAAPKPAEPEPAQQTEQAAAPVAAETATEPADKATEEKPEAPAQSFAIGLSATTADDEAKKRAERAKRFGLEEDDDAKKRADRAKRFGLDEKELTGLDSALPERPLKRGRAREGDEAAGRGNKRQSLDRRGDRQGRGRHNGQGDRRRAGSNGPAKKASILDDPTEREKAAKRAARFAA
ncbi:DNA-binding SAP [Purpureocillium lilacinum]|uniref:DNA-binding SAP n=1 Tax=Purpureocillium lilacinum TaxID=33203 RepID=A0A179GMA4_PURLI|nr:DNA-binding SAP [Purpureocillium lilacinum]